MVVMELCGLYVSDADTTAVPKGLPSRCFGKGMGKASFLGKDGLLCDKLGCAEQCGFLGAVSPLPGGLRG